MLGGAIGGVLLRVILVKWTHIHRYIRTDGQGNLLQRLQSLLRVTFTTCKRIYNVTVTYIHICTNITLRNQEKKIRLLCRARIRQKKRKRKHDNSPLYMEGARDSYLYTFVAEKVFPLPHTVDEKTDI